MCEKRVKFVEEQTQTKEKMLKKHRDELQSATSDFLPDVRKRHAIEMKNLKTKFAKKLRANDMKIGMDFDLLVNQQQVTLEKARVPGFFITNKAPELQFQMDLMCLIEDLNSSDSKDFNSSDSLS